MKFSKICFIIFASVLLLAQSLNTEEHKKKHKRSKSKSRKAQVELSDKPNVNKTFMNYSYSVLNASSTLDLAGFHSAKIWDYKIMDKQFDSLFNMMTMKQLSYRTLFSDRNFMALFQNSFNACDENKDQSLDIKEFTKCMDEDEFLWRIKPANDRFVNDKNMTAKANFIERIFELMDAHNLSYLNFHDFMEFRLMVFSWRKCSAGAPFLEETSWECSLNLVSEYNNLSRPTLRTLFFMSLDLVNSSNSRNVDFITYLYFATSARLFGRINGKGDGDISRAEFNLVLDQNILPFRYNHEVVEAMFKLTKDDNKDNHGIDFLSFVFYDYGLRLFTLKNSTRHYNLNYDEFVQVLSKTVFSGSMMTELQMTPMTNHTETSLSMYQYMNVRNFHDEGDFLVKLEKSSKNLKSKSRLRSRSSQNPNIFSLPSNVTFSLPFVAKRYFEILDSNSDGFANFYEFGFFYQVLYLFGKVDTLKRGKIVAGELYEKLHYHSDFPRVSSTLMVRANRFSLFNEDDYLDFFTAHLVLRIDDIMELYTRKTDKSTVYEVELKRVFLKVNLKYLNESLLNRCLRGMDKNNVPKYDWECSFVLAIQQTISYNEGASAFNTVKNYNLNLTNTVFYNLDQNLNKTAGF